MDTPMACPLCSQNNQKLICLLNSGISPGCAAVRSGDSFQARQTKVAVPLETTLVPFHFQDIRIGQRFGFFSSEAAGQRVEEQAKNIAMGENGARAGRPLRNFTQHPAHPRLRGDGWLAIGQRESEILPGFAPHFVRRMAAVVHDQSLPQIIDNENFKRVLLREWRRGGEGSDEWTGKHLGDPKRAEQIGQLPGLPHAKGT